MGEARRREGWRRRRCRANWLAVGATAVPPDCPAQPPMPSRLQSRPLVASQLPTTQARARRHKLVAAAAHLVVRHAGDEGLLACRRRSTAGLRSAAARCCARSRPAGCALVPTPARQPCATPTPCAASLRWVSVLVCRSALAVDMHYLLVRVCRSVSACALVLCLLFRHSVS